MNSAPGQEKPHLRGLPSTGVSPAENFEYPEDVNRHESSKALRAGPRLVNVSFRMLQVMAAHGPDIVWDVDHPWDVVSWRTMFQMFQGISCGEEPTRHPGATRVKLLWVTLEAFKQLKLQKDDYDYGMA